MKKVETRIGDRTNNPQTCFNFLEKTDLYIHDETHKQNFPKSLQQRSTDLDQEIPHPHKKNSKLFFDFPDFTLDNGVVGNTRQKGNARHMKTS